MDENGLTLGDIFRNVMKELEAHTELRRVYVDTALPGSDTGKVAVGVHIRVQGWTCDMQPFYATTPYPSLEELQQAVDGYIETIYYRNEQMQEDWVMVVNEEGLIKGFSHNHVASNIVGRYIVGDVVCLPVARFN